MLIDYMVMEVTPGSERLTGWGSMQFAIQPRMGEIITKDADGIGHAYEVLMILHPHEPVAGHDGADHCGGDLYLIDRGELIEWRKRFLSRQL